VIQGREVSKKLPSAHQAGHKSSVSSVVLRGILDYKDLNNLSIYDIAKKFGFN
jgi:hypothetical protein